MSAGEPTAGDVFSALGQAADELGSFVTHVIDEQPAAALIGALAVGFIAGGGLASPVGAKITTTTLRATLGNLATLVAVDLLRRSLEDGAHGAARAGTPD